MRVDRAARRIEATADRIYQALTDRDMVQTWLPPQGARGAIEAFEPWPGGAFRMTLIFETPGQPGKSSPDTDIVEGRFVELVPDRLVRQSFEFRSEDPAFAGTMVMSWTLTPRRDGTDVAITAENVPAGIRPQDHVTGMESSLANLAGCVERGGLGTGTSPAGA